MASVSVSELILFVAAISVAAAVSGVLIETVSELSSSVSQSGDQLQTNLETDINIISDPGSDAVTSGDQVVVLVKNTGSTALSDGRLDVLLNGRFVEPANRTVSLVGGETGGEWSRGGVVRVTVDRPPEQGTNRVVTIINDDRDGFEFFHT